MSETLVSCMEVEYKVWVRQAGKLRGHLSLYNKCHLKIVTFNKDLGSN